MKRKTTEKDIVRFLELKAQEADIKSELSELRDMFLDDIDFAIPDDENENVVNIKIGKSVVHITTVVKPYFDSRTFGKDYPELKAKYTSDRTEDRVTADSER